MKIKSRPTVLILACSLVISTGTSCSVFRNMFGPKYGCPGNGKNVGAERILSGEKVPKAKKFKA
ncbi:MAG TPA: hypothetical protein VJT83_06065 [Chitinophagaceae bacterium]|nr:hypothetical protein [Chitinophagaceae bacterium]